MDATPNSGYTPPKGFVKDTRNPLIDLELTDSTELWLIQCPMPANIPPGFDLWQQTSTDFDGRQVPLKLDGDGHLGTFEDSSGKSYDMVSHRYPGPEAIVFLSSASEAKIAGKISRRVSLVHYPEPSEIPKRPKRHNPFLSGSQWSSATTSTISGRRMPTPTRSIKPTPTRSIKPTPTRSIKPGNSQTMSGYSTPSSRNKSTVSSEQPSKSSKRKRVDEQSRSVNHSAQDSGKGNSGVTSIGSLEHSVERKSKKKRKNDN